jgi:hypothetical protein
MPGEKAMTPDELENAIRELADNSGLSVQKVVDVLQSLADEFEMSIEEDT